MSRRFTEKGSEPVGQRADPGRTIESSSASLLLPADIGAAAGVLPRLMLLASRFRHQAANPTAFTILQAASYLIPVVTVPYFARVLGIAGMGQLAMSGIGAPLACAYGGILGMAAATLTVELAMATFCAVSVGRALRSSAGGNLNR